MSDWSHITACIYVETEIQDKNIKEILEEILRQAPKITGSEGNAEVYINIPPYHTFYVSCDCGHCGFGHTRKRLPKGGFKCAAPEEYECKEGEFQTCAVITVAGNLRDRLPEQTKTEYKEFLKWVKARVWDVIQETHKIL